MKIKLDENLSERLVATFESAGHDCHTVSLEGLIAEPDSVIAQAANHEDRILLTLDLDFADMRKYAPGTHPGIIVFRLNNLSPQHVTRFVEQFAIHTALEQFSRCLVSVSENSIRVQSPPDTGQ